MILLGISVIEKVSPTLGKKFYRGSDKVMKKKYFVLVIICFVLMSIAEVIKIIMKNSQFFTGKEYVVYYISTAFNIVVGVILVGSFIYLYRKYER